jgi:SAM-dependent methyltransferase
MLGETLDYLILRPLTHSRNLKTEEELNSSAAQQAWLNIEDAMFRLRKLMSRLENNLPISESLHYLDIGCGTGDMAIALAKLGCKKVTGIDLVPRRVSQARLNARRSGVDRYVDFVCKDIYDWTPAERYDVVLSHEALEHIHSPQTLFEMIAKLVTPTGIVILAFGPLFHSPFGDHMNSFFRVQIPWRGVVFSEKAILRLRRERFRLTEMANRYRNISGGLNLMRYSEFLHYVQVAGWEFSYLCVNPQLKRILPLYHLSNLLIKIPFVRDYFASSIYAVLRRRSP